MAENCTIDVLAVQVTEEQLAAAFEDCGQVVDCRVCCDTNSAMRFAFIEFYHGDSVQKARLLVTCATRPAPVLLPPLA